MLRFLVIGCAAMFVAVSCYPRPTTVGPGAEPGEDFNNYIEEPYEKKVKYHYAYGIDDPSSGVFSHKWEERVGNYVKGAYSMVEADGRIRTVDYEVDGPKGFHAIVRTSPPGNNFLSYQQLRKSRDSNPNPPVNVLTNNIPKEPVIEPRTPRLIHKDLPPNFHSVKPDYFWGSAPGGHEEKHQQKHGHPENSHRNSNSKTTMAAFSTHSNHRVPVTASSLGDSNGNNQFEGRGRVGHGQNTHSSFSSSHRDQNRGHDSIQNRTPQNYNHNSNSRTENLEGSFSSRQAKSQRQESERDNFLVGDAGDLSGEMLPPRRNAEIMNYDHLLRAGQITDALYL